MLVLALETVTRAGSVAVLDGTTSDAAWGDPTRTHGERLPHDVTAALARQRHTLADVDLFAVVSGPGSFTGLRVGMAAIQGFALSRGRLVVPVPTLNAIATGWITSAQATVPTILVACLDGQRGEVFFAGWDVAPGQSLEEARAILEPAVAPPAELASMLTAHWHSDGLPIQIVGNGATQYAEEFSRLGPQVAVADLAVPLAEVAAHVAAAHPERAVAPHALRPLYVRRPDAVLARDRARSVASSASSPEGGFTISRVVSRDDVLAVEQLQRRTFTNPWAAESIRWELEHTDVARLYVMRGPHTEIVAYCACWIVFDELHINSLAVDEAWRRRGHARRLLEAVLADAAAAGARSATLEVRRSNDAARALYEGLGFSVDAVRRDYYQHPREDALILWNRRLATDTIAPQVTGT